MATVLINYTHKPGDNYDPYERIKGVAGEAGGGWYRTTDQVLNDLRSGLNKYYVSVNNDSVWVVEANRNGRPYIKTEADGDEPNNLLALDEPPARLLP